MNPNIGDTALVNGRWYTVEDTDDAAGQAFLQDDKGEAHWMSYAVIEQVVS